MNAIIAEYLRGLLSSLEWCEDVSGVVRVVTKKIEIGEGKIIIKRFPVACDISWQDCNNNEQILRMCTPDSSKISIIYFEDKGVSSIDNAGRTTYKSKLRLVCWMNMKKFVNQGCSLDFYAINKIKSLIQLSRPANYNSIVHGIVVKEISIAPKQPDIFSPYSYNEFMQYLLFPYDYFALDITTEFMIDGPCVPELTLTDDDMCN